MSERLSILHLEIAECRNQQLRDALRDQPAALEDADLQDDKRDDDVDMDQSSADAKEDEEIIRRSYSRRRRKNVKPLQWMLKQKDRSDKPLTRAEVFRHNLKVLKRAFGDHGKRKGPGPVVEKAEEIEDIDYLDPKILEELMM